MTSENNIKGSPWPGNCRGAVSLSFDDGLQSQLDIAVPILQEYNLFATFYINPEGEDWNKRHAPWRDVALEGHEVGNHTINHTCSRSFASTPDEKSLATTTLDEMEEDILEAERRLSELIPEQSAHTFCYPCYQTYVGEGAARQSYVPVIAKHFSAARGQGETGNHPWFCDIHCLNAWTMAGWMSGSDLCGFVDTAVKQERWGILAFHEFQHGPGSAFSPGSYSHEPPLPADNFRKLCDYLDKNRKYIWTDTVIKISQQIIDWRITIKQ